VVGIFCRNFESLLRSKTQKLPCHTCKNVGILTDERTKCINTRIRVTLTNDNQNQNSYFIMAERKHYKKEKNVFTKVTTIKSMPFNISQIEIHMRSDIFMAMVL
jgi:hypothetical protein